MTKTITLKRKNVIVRFQKSDLMITRQEFMQLNNGSLAMTQFITLPSTLGLRHLVNQYVIAKGSAQDWKVLATNCLIKSS